VRSTEIGEWINPFVSVMVEKARDHIESILNLHIWFKKLVTSDEKDQVTWEEVNNNIVDEFLANQKDIEEKLGWAAELGQRRYIYCLFPFLQVARARETALQLEKEKDQTEAAFRKREKSLYAWSQQLQNANYMVQEFAEDVSGTSLAKTLKAEEELKASKMWDCWLNVTSCFAKMAKEVHAIASKKELQMESLYETYPEQPVQPEELMVVVNSPDANELRTLWKPLVNMRYLALRLMEGNFVKLDADGEAENDGEMQETCDKFFEVAAKVSEACAIRALFKKLPEKDLKAKRVAAIEEAEQVIVAIEGVWPVQLKAGAEKILGRELNLGPRGDNGSD